MTSVKMMVMGEKWGDGGNGRNQHGVAKKIKASCSSEHRNNGEISRRQHSSGKASAWQNSGRKQHSRGVPLMTCQSSTACAQRRMENI